MAEDMDPGAEFCRLVDCARVGRSVETHTIEADEGERKALADRLGLLSLDGLKARIGLCRTSRGLLKLTAKFKARCVQSCVVTLQPVRQELDEEFELYFKEDTDRTEIDKVELPIEDELWPEPLEQGGIDLGEAVSQQLALALDPYPRARGVVFEDVAKREVAAEQTGPLAEIGKLLPIGHRGDDKK